MTDIISNTLNERGTTHGDFNVNSAISQAIKDIMRDTPNWPKLKPFQKEALEMTAHKIGRLLAGDPDFLDHWIDAQGYLKLAWERIQPPAVKLGHSPRPITYCPHGTPHVYSCDKCDAQIESGFDDPTLPQQ